MLRRPPSTLFQPRSTPAGGHLAEGLFYDVADTSTFDDDEFGCGHRLRYLLLSPSDLRRLRHPNWDELAKPLVCTTL